MISMQKNVICIFYAGNRTSDLHAAVNLCRIFIEEIFGGNQVYDLDEETLTTINKFFENNLNVSETSRQLSYTEIRLYIGLKSCRKRQGWISEPLRTR